MKTDTPSLINSKQSMRKVQILRALCGDMRHRTLFEASPGEPIGKTSVDREAYARK